MYTSESLPIVSREELLKEYLRKRLKDSEQVEKAFNFVEQLHKKNTRFSGNSYVQEHIYPVAKTVIEQTPPALLSEKIFQASILHDAFEDADSVEMHKIIASFGKEVSSWVLQLSKKAGVNIFANFPLYTPIRDYIFHIKLNKSPWQVKLIKVCDRYNNLFCSYILYKNKKLSKFAYAKGQECLDETKSFYLELSKNLDDEIGSRTYNQLYNLVTKFDQLIDATKTKSSAGESS